MTIDRTPKPCLHPRARHQHGHRLAYICDRCRCLPCCADNSTYETHRRRQQAYGRTPTGLIDAGPARAHVQALQAAGLGWKPIARVAGVPTGTVSRLLFGKLERGKRRAPSKRINPVAAARLLAVPLPGVDQLRDGAVTDGTGTRRRLQALVAAGWTQSALAARLGMSTGNFGSLIHGHVRKAGSGRVVASTARAVSALYDDLWDVPGPPAYGRPRALATAARHGWAPPLAWDDDTIDDPAARPNRGTALRHQDGTAFDEVAVLRAMHGDPVLLRPVERAEVVHRLTAAGLSAAEIAPRVGLEKRSVQRIRDQRRAEEAA